MSNNFEQFIKEVESDLRQEKFEKLWKQYGKNITIGFVVLVGLSGAFNLWQHHQVKQRDVISQQFLNAQTLMFNKSSGDALAAMEGIAKSSHKTYATLAKFNMATILRQPTGHQDLQRAADVYQEIMNDRSAEHMLRDLATVLFVGLRLETLKIDKSGLEELRQLIEKCAKDGAPYRHLALELCGMIELRMIDLHKNSPAKAIEIFTKLAQDEKTPKDLRLRAQMVSQNLASQLTAKVD